MSTLYAKLVQYAPATEAGMRELLVGELAFAKDTERLWIGTETGNTLLVTSAGDTGDFIEMDMGDVSTGVIGQGLIDLGEV